MNMNMKYSWNQCGNDKQIESELSHECEARLGIVLKISSLLKWTWTSVNMKYSCNKCGNEWRWNWSGTWTWNILGTNVEMTDKLNQNYHMNVKPGLGLYWKYQVCPSEHELQWTWTSVNMKYSCNKCGNEWRWNQTGACTLTLLQLLWKKLPEKRWNALTKDEEKEERTTATATATATAKATATSLGSSGFSVSLGSSELSGSLESSGSGTWTLTILAINVDMRRDKMNQNYHMNVKPQEIRLRDYVANNTAFKR